MRTETSRGVKRAKSWLDFSLQYGAKSRNVGLSILFISEFEERGARKSYHRDNWLVAAKRS